MAPSYRTRASLFKWVAEPGVWNHDNHLLWQPLFLQSFSCLFCVPGLFISLWFIYFFGTFVFSFALWYSRFHGMESTFSLPYIAWVSCGNGWVHQVCTKWTGVTAMCFRLGGEGLGREYQWANLIFRVFPHSRHYGWVIVVFQWLFWLL